MNRLPVTKDGGICSSFLSYEATQCFHEPLKTTEKSCILKTHGFPPPTNSVLKTSEHGERLNSFCTNILSQSSGNTSL